jgi:hypothetical protein
MSETVNAALARLTRVAGVQGALVVDAEAGVPVASELAADVPETALAALAASLFRRTAEAVQAGGFGAPRTLQLEAKAGHIVVAAAGALFVVVLAEPGAQLGLVRVQVRRAAEELKP